MRDVHVCMFVCVRVCLRGWEIKQRMTHENADSGILRIKPQSDKVIQRLWMEWIDDILF